MPKHNNLDIYPFDPSIDARDGVFGFDYNTGRKSKNFKMEHLRYFILQGLDPSNNGFVTTTGYTLVGNLLTINAGWVWQLNGMLFTNEEDIVFTLEYTAAGFVRIDSVYANSNNELLLTSGGESETIAVPPQIPINTLLAFSVNIFDTTIVAEEEPVIGNIYQQKQFDYLQTYTGTGTDVVIPLNTTGRSHIQLKGTMKSVAGLSFADLVANPVNAEYPHYGKRYLFFNDSGHDIVLKHLAATEDIFFTFKEETDLVFPNGEFLEFFNGGSNVFVNVFRSWKDISKKLDKVTSKDVEKVYIKNANGTQGMKPTSEFGGSDYLYKTVEWVAFRLTTQNTWKMPVQMHNNFPNTIIGDWGTSTLPENNNGGYGQNGFAIPDGYIIDKIQLEVDFKLEGSYDSQLQVYIKRIEATDADLSNNTTNTLDLVNQIVSIGYGSIGLKFTKNLTVASHSLPTLARSFVIAGVRETGVGNGYLAIKFNYIFKKI